MSRFFDGIAQEPVVYRGYRAKAPLFYRDVRAMAGIFTADLRAASAWMPTPRHHPLTLGPGRAVVALHCFEYADSDIGPYGEVALSVAVAHGRRPVAPALELARAVLTDRYHAHVVHLPVTTEAALWGGIDLFGYPKWLAAIGFAETATHRTCTLRDPVSGRLILEVTGTKLPVRTGSRDASGRRTMTMSTYPVKDGRTLHARLEVHLLAWGCTFLRRHLRLRLGDHPMADALAALRLGLPLQYLWAPRCEAMLHRPEPSP